MMFYLTSIKKNPTDKHISSIFFSAVGRLHDAKSRRVCVGLVVPQYMPKDLLRWFVRLSSADCA